MLVAGSSVAQLPPIRSGASLFIEPMNGFETDLAAAFANRAVPLVIVQDRSKADFVLRSTLIAHTPVPAAIILNNKGVPSGYPVTRKIPDTQVQGNITMIDVRSSQVVFTYSVRRNEDDEGQRKRTAESCAKRLKQLVVIPRDVKP
jgi:hypothetical protein